MAEPIPSANENEESTVPANAEDRKAAAALDSLNANAMSQENGESSGNKQPTAADQEALGQAMARLERMKGMQSKSPKKKEDEKKDDATKKEAEARKKIKLSSEDVQFLICELDLPKTKATELLRAHDGVLDAAVKSFVLAPAKA